jgi:ABC-type uncharacterized transport system permease subunit
VRPLVIIYWTRFVLGVVSALISTFVALATGIKAGAYDLNSFINGLTIALLVYLLSYYVIKAKLGSKIEKPSKIMTMGIGIYFFTWIVCWVLFFSLIHG